MPTKTKKSPVAREIASRNRRFKGASPAGKRVMIAKDVIAQIKAGRLKAQSGTWVQPVNSKGQDIFVYDKFYGNESLRELFLEKKIPKCECCALGAMFMSCTLYNNKTTVDDFDREVGWRFEDLVELGGFSNGLTEFFSGDQLKLIESAFEGGDGAFQEKNLESWMEELPDDRKRLIAIMENIIKNKGTFKP